MNTYYDSVGMTSDGIVLTVQAFSIENDGNGKVTGKTLLDDNGLGVYLVSEVGHGDSKI